jgi:hypothetical protein
MADNIVAGLFGLTPQMYGEQQRTSALAEGIRLAQLSPEAAGAAMTYAGARGLGGAIAGALGVEDPQLKMISVRQQILSQLDQSDPESYSKGVQMLAQAGDQQGAMALAQYARQAQESAAQTQQRRAAALSSEATAAKTQLSIDQEKQLRDELSALGTNATQDQILGVITKYGSPDRVLAALTAAETRREATQAKTESGTAANQAKVDAAKVAADAKIEAARVAGATAKEIAQMRIDSARDLKEFAASLKESASAELLTPKEKQKREAGYPQATSAISSFETKADSFVKDIEKLRDSPGLSEITGFAAGRIPGITANGRAAQALYDKIVAKGGFQALQDLRDASKTGGALGNVSNQEGKQLTASFAAIDRRQDAKDVKAALDQAIGDIQGSKTRLREAYDMTYSYKAEQPKKTLSGEDQQALNWANSNPNDPRSAQIKNRLGVK